MKNKMFIIISLLFLSISIVDAQKIKDFSIEENTSIYFVRPNFLKAPDFTKSTRYEVMDQKYMVSLIDSVKKGTLHEIIDKKIMSRKSKIIVCFDKIGKIIYGYFELNAIDKPGEKLTEEDLRKILEGFMNMKIDMSKIETKFEPDFQLGVLFILLKEKKK